MIYNLSFKENNWFLSPPLPLPEFSLFRQRGKLYFYKQLLINMNR